MRRHPLAVSLLLLLAALGAYLSHYGFRPSALVNFGDDGIRKLPQARQYLEPGFVIFQGRGGYDAQWDYYVACDPLARKRLYDHPYRYQRIGLPLGSCLLAGGRRAWIPTAMAALNLAGACLGGLCLLGLLGRPHASWLGVAVCSAAQLTQLQVDNSAVLSMGLCLAGLWLRERGRPLGMAAALALALLSRESALVLLAILGSWELKEGRWRWALLTAAAALPFLGWQLYLRQVLGQWALGTSAGHLVPPLAGYVGRVMEIPPDWAGLPAAEVLRHNLALICVLAYLLTASAGAIRLFLKRRSFYSAALLAHVAVLLCVSKGQLVDPNGAGRVFLPVPFLYLLSLGEKPHWLDRLVLWGGATLGALFAVKIGFFNAFPYLLYAP